jgi:hypothetical protein
VLDPDSIDARGGAGKVQRLGHVLYPHRGTELPSQDLALVVVEHG